jgi:hypothetical protein
MSLTSNDIRVKLYNEATSLTQSFLDQTFNYGETKLQAVCMIEKNGTSIRVSSIPKYVGDNFYEGRATLPTIKKSMGEFLSTTFQFDDTSIDISNVDGFYSTYFLGGANYVNFIGATMTFMLGVSDIESTYINIFTGTVKNENGVNIDKETIGFQAQNNLTNFNKTVDLPEITKTIFPSCPDDVVGKKIPIVIGDWTVGCNVVQTGSVKVNVGGTDYDAETYTTNNFYGAVVGYYVGGGYFIFATGNYTPSTISNAWLKRGDKLLAVNFNSTAQVVGGYYACLISTIKQLGGGTIVYNYEQGDELVISVNVGADDNIISQSQKILTDILGISSYSSNWDVLKNKATPSQSAISTIKSRVWLGEAETSILEYVNSMLMQVRLKLLVLNDGSLDLFSLHFEDWPTYTSLRQIDKFQVVENTIKINTEPKNFICGANGNYAFTSVAKATMLRTTLKINETSRTAIGGSKLLKTIDFPNLYVASDVDNQVTEYVRFFSFPLEYITFTTAWTGLLDDVGDFVNVNIQLGSINYSNVPCVIMDKSVNLQTFEIQYKLLSLNGFSYPNNLLSYSGALSSYNQTLS